MPDKIDLKLKPQLTKILAQLKLDIPEQASDKIIEYLTLLQQWNKVYNLTAIRDPEQMLYKHIADSLAVAPYLVEGQRWLDVGSGAGLPGIPLALLFPEREWTLLDSNGKKTRFLLQAKAALALHNVSVVQSRVENFIPQHCFDAVIARAFAKLNEIIAATSHLYCPGGRLWALKGIYPTEELQAVQQPVTVHSLQVPGLIEQRHLVCVSVTKEPVLIR